jgi:hypothetical protein
MHPLVAAEFRGRVEAALAAAKEVGRIRHRGLAGQVREILVRDLLRPLVPHYMGFGTGKIVDHLGGESAQIDVVVYDKRMMPPLAYGLERDVGLFPVEACVYAVEVKTRATARAVREAMSVARSVCALRYAPEWCHDGVPVGRVATSLYAFGSTARSSEAELQRWLREQGEHDCLLARNVNGTWVQLPAPALHVMCIVGSGYGYFEPALAEYRWATADSDRAEILSWLGGISNTLLGRTAVPAIPFGHYFLQGADFDRRAPDGTPLT